MVSSVGDKDIALVAMKLTSEGEILFEDNKAIFEILDITDKTNTGVSSFDNFDININHYPSHLGFYVKNENNAYYEHNAAKNRDIGAHHISTLPGSSGAAVFYNDNGTNKVIGVHVASGQPKSSHVQEIYYGSDGIITTDNIFELINISELKHFVSVNKNMRSVVMANLVNLVIS